MSENNKVGIDIQSSYKGDGTKAAIEDQKKLAATTKDLQADERAALTAQDKFKADLAERARQRAEREAAAAQRALEKETNAIGNAARETVEHNRGLETAVAAGRVAMVAGVAAAAGLAAITVKLGSAWAKSADEIGTLSEKTRISVEELSLMRLESEETNVSLEKLGTGYKNLSVKMFEANSGNKQAQALFKALGVEYTDGTGRLRNAREVMDDVATAMAGMSGETEKSALASKLLGRGIGEDLMPYLNTGGEKLKGFRKEAKELGLEMDTETVKAVKDMWDNVNILNMAAEEAAGKIAGPFVKSMVEITKAMREGAKEGGAFWAVLRGVLKAGDEVMGNNEVDALQKKAGVFTRDITRMESQLAETETDRNGKVRYKVRGNQRALREQELQAALQGQAGIYRQIGEAEGSGVEDTPEKIPAPSGIAKGGKKKTGRTGKSREQILEEQDRRNWVDHAENVFKDADRENLDNAKEADKRAQAAEREAEALDRLERQYKDLIDPMQPLRRELANLEKLWNAGRLTSDQYTEGLFNVQNRMDDLNNKAREVKDGGLKEFKDAIHGWGRESSREIGRMVVDGEFNLKRLGNAFKNLATDIIAAQVQKQFFDGPNGLVAMGGNLLGDVGKWIAGQFHEGGVVGAGGGARMVHPAYYERAPRYHSGGIAGNEVPAVLQRGEEVLTRNDPRHRYNGGGAGNVRVEIINNGTPQEVTSAQPTFDVDGMVLQIFMRDMQTGGPMRRAVESLQRPAM